MTNKLVINNEMKNELIKYHSSSNAGNFYYVKHFKYNPNKHPTKYLYKILSIGHDCDNYNRLLVTYQSMEKPEYVKNDIFVRDLNEFCSEIDKEKYPIEYQSQRYRFVKINEKFILETRIGHLLDNMKKK